MKDMTMAQLLEEIGKLSAERETLYKAKVKRITNKVRYGKFAPHVAHWDWVTFARMNELRHTDAQEIHAIAIKKVMK